MLSSWIYEIADLYLQNENAAALLTVDGDVLYAKSDLNFEVWGYKSLAESALKYVKLQPGEILLTNDSFAGGSYLHRYTFLMPISTSANNSVGLILCLRREFSPRLQICDKLDEEGLRIPPTPIFQNGQKIDMIIEAMSGHPLCPQGFKEWLGESVTLLQNKFAQWKNLETMLKPHFSPAEIKNFLRFSHQFAVEKLSEKAQFETRTELRLDSGETLKMHVEVHEGIAKVDFGGSGPGFKTHMPDLSAGGSCFAALGEFYGFSCLQNSGTFSILQVTKPLGCFLNAKYPSSPHRGFREGVAAVKTAMNMALHQMIKTPEAPKSQNTVKLEAGFNNGKHWLSQWTGLNCCESLSVEKIESQYPVQVLSLQKNPEKMHLQVELKFLESCQLRWMSDFSQYSFKTPKHLKAPEKTKIEVQSSQGDWTSLNFQGSRDMLPGDVLKLQHWALFESV